MTLFNFVLKNTINNKHKDNDTPVLGGSYLCLKYAVKESLRDYLCDVM